MITNIKTADKIASCLLEIEAVKLNTIKPFQWASGWKSPIYCDNRLSLSYPEIRSYIKNSLVSLIKKQFPEAEAIAGVATAGIPQGALLADKLNLPFIYVRSKAKEHGLSNQVEGRIRKGMKTVVVEDLVSTGGSSLMVVDVLRDSKVKVLGMVSIFTYGFKQANANFIAKRVKLFSLCDYARLIEVARARDYVTEEQLIKLKSWRVDPGNWGS
jgi:orotate phosphoribosyltransferase